MDSIVSWSKDWGDSGGIAGERRSDRRYRIRLDLRWKLIRRRKIQDTGVGRTVDLSSGGILFEAARELPVGLNVELSISWPVLLHQVAPMQLVASGRIVRSDGQQVALRMTQHEFRTVGTNSDHRDVNSNSSRTSRHFSDAGMPMFGRY
jgi:hypothetical protein